jgi:HSP20 family molecular chaperone IbpA
MSNVTSYISTTGDRKIIDLVVPGYAKDDITVSSAIRNGGKQFVLTVKGKYVRPTGATGKAVPRFGFDKVVGDSFKWTQELPLENDYDLEKIVWDSKNGVVRISVPKTKAAIGSKVAAAGAGVNINAVGSDEED